jgi:hypothetical protein
MLDSILPIGRINYSQNQLNKSSILVLGYNYYHAHQNIVTILTQFNLDFYQNDNYHIYRIMMMMNIICARIL